MEHSKESINEQESLKIIHEMISKAKNDLSDQAFYPILWGWVVLIGSIGHFVLLQYTSFEKPSLIWLIIIVGIIGSIAKGFSQRKDTGATTYANSIIAMIWVVFLINYFILLPFIDEINFMITPIILLMAGGSIFLSGFTVKFKPFYFGGIFAWLMAIVAFIVTVQYQLLVCAAAMLFGLLIPGYILKSREEK